MQTSLCDNNVSIGNVTRRLCISLLDWAC